VDNFFTGGLSKPFFLHLRRSVGLSQYLCREGERENLMSQEIKEIIERVIGTSLTSYQILEIDTRLHSAYVNNEFWSELDKIKAEYKR